MSLYPPDVLDRFWSKVDRSAGFFGCWIWTGARNTPKHPRWSGTRRPVFRLVHRPQVTVYAHRLVLSIHDGVPLWDRQHQQACHRCANPLCVNPEHLYWGTSADNVTDRYPGRRGRMAKMKLGLGELTP